MFLLLLSEVGSYLLLLVQARGNSFPSHLSNGNRSGIMTHWASQRSNPGCWRYCWCGANYPLAQCSAWRHNKNGKHHTSDLLDPFYCLCYIPFFFFSPPPLFFFFLRRTFKWKGNELMSAVHSIYKNQFPLHDCMCYSGTASCITKFAIKIVSR